MDALTQERVAAVVGARPIAWRRPDGGYTAAERWVTELDDGSSCFVKIATEPTTQGMIPAETTFYRACQERFAPQLIGWEDDPDRPLLVLEDLSAGRWPPPWTDGAVGAVLAALADVAATEPPDHVRRLSEYREALSGWDEIAMDPEAFLGIGMVDHNWIERPLPLLRRVADSADLDGEVLVHFDVRSDNVCLLENRTVLVDWSGPAVGNLVFDVVAWAPSLAFEGGPAPEALTARAGLATAQVAPVAALIAGYFAANAGLPPIPGAPHVRRVQREQLSVALPWVCRLLGFDMPVVDKL